MTDSPFTNGNSPHRPGRWPAAAATVVGGLVAVIGLTAVVGWVVGTESPLRPNLRWALREREELLRNIIAHIPCGVFWKDRASVLVGCNDQFARDLGFATPAEVVGRSDIELPVTAGEAEGFRACDLMVIEKGAAVLNLEETQTRPTGRVTLLTSKVPLRDRNGAVVGVLGVYQDITDRKRLEERLLRAQKMEAVGRLAGGIAHDFNNLLTVIRGNADLLRGAPGELVAEIREAADRAAGLVRQLLTFSRRQPSRPEVVDLNEVVVGLTGLLRRLLGETIAVRTELSPNKVAVRADRGQVEQVVMNLAVNARDAMPAGGSLTFGTERVYGPEGYVVARLSVTDSGGGMTEEVKGRIFEPFFTTKGPDRGTGLGLATVFGIVEQAGGRFEVESAPGTGSTFRVDLPACDDDPTASTVIAYQELLTRPAHGAGRSVLLVEDEDGVRKLARFALEAHGYVVTEAPDADDAAARLGPGLSVDLLVTDMTMPGMDGRELAERVRTHYPDAGVVFISGYVPESGRVDGLPGAFFLPKPFTPADLVRAAGRARPRAPAPATITPG